MLANDRSLWSTEGMSTTARIARPPFRVSLLAVTLLSVDDRHCPLR